MQHFFFIIIFLRKKLTRTFFYVRHAFNSVHNTLLGPWWPIFQFWTYMSHLAPNQWALPPLRYSEWLRRRGRTFHLSAFRERLRRRRSAMVELCFVLDLRSLPPPFLSDLKQVNERLNPILTLLFQIIQIIRPLICALIETKSRSVWVWLVNFVSHCCSSLISTRFRRRRPGANRSRSEIG